MLKDHPLTWVVVADKCQAKIYRMLKFPKLEEISHFEHPESGLHNQDLISSKPGRGFQSVGKSRSSYQQETTPKQNEAIKFATEIAHQLNTASNQGKFNQLYLIAAPGFLGLLRQHIHSNIQKLIIGEMAKELTSSTQEEIEHHLRELKDFCKTD